MAGDVSKRPDRLLRSTAPTAMACLDDATLDDLVAGRLAGETLARADRHLDACALCRTVVTTLAAGRAAASGDRPIEPGAEPVARGSKIGRYVVLDRIGGGGMGEVHEAHDPELDRRVALKLLRSGAMAPAAVIEERMRREAQAMARLAHPNVVTVFDVGRAAGRIWLAMELVQGVTLREWMRPGARGWREIRDVFVQAGRGLAAAHGAGLVHRDFKPENVIVGADGRVRVTDFGLARDDAEGGAEGIANAGRASASVDLGASLTVTGALLGTPAYMAPEQLEGRGADASSDQFAFGVALFEALHGARPFHATSMEGLRRAFDQPPRRAGSSGVPAWLDRAVARTLSRRPADRWPSMRALLSALEGDRVRGRVELAAVAVGLLVATAAAATWIARPGPAKEACGGGPAATEAVWSPARAGRVRAAFGATGSPIAKSSADATVTGLDVFATTWALVHRATCSATRVTHEQSEALLDVRMACLARGLGAADALVAAFEHADRETVAHAAEAVADLPLAGSCATATTLADPRPTDPAALAKLRTLERSLDGVRAATASGKYAPTIPAARSAVGDATALGHQPAIAEARLALATLLRRSGSVVDAAREAREALLAAEKARDDRAAARAWLELLAAQGEGGAWTDAATTALHATAAVARLGDPPDLSAAVLHSSGVVSTNLGRFDDAARELEQALSLRRRTLGDEHVDVARTLTAAGNLARARGDLDRALETHRRALAMDERLLGRGHPATARHMHNVAGVLRLLGRRDEAMKSYQAAHEISRSALGDAHPSVGLTRNSIGLVLLDDGDVAGARAHFDAALAILEKAHHPERATALQNVAASMARDGRHAEALEQLRAAHQIVVATLGAEHERAREIQKNIRASEEALAAASRGRRGSAPAAPPPQRDGGPRGTYAPSQTLDLW